MDMGKIGGYLLLAIALAIVLSVLFATVWFLVKMDESMLNFVAGAFLIGLPVVIILAAVIFAQLMYMAKDRRADAVERMAHSPQQPQVMVLPNQMQNGNGQMPYRYRAVLPGSGGYQDDMVVPGVVMGEAERL